MAAFFIPLISLAQSSQSVEIPNPLNIKTIWDIIGRVIDFLFVISLIVAVFAVIYAGYLFLFSQADPEKIKTARHVIYYSLAGVIVVFLSKSIINLLLEVLGSNAKIP